MRKRKALACSIIVLAVSLLCSQALPGAAARSGTNTRNPYAGSTLYVGHDPGVRTAFRIRGRKLLLATVLMRLNCVGPRGRHHYSRVTKTFAVAEAPLSIDLRGRFVVRPDRDEEPGFVLEDGIAGVATPDEVTGNALYFANLEYRDLRCQTGDRLPHVGAEPSRVRFRAERR